MATYDQPLCSEALNILRHDPISLSEDHFGQLELIGRGDDAREAQRLAILARVPEVVTKSIEPLAPAPPAKARASNTTRHVVTEKELFAAMDVVVEQIIKAVKPLRDRIKNLESENASLTADSAATKDRLLLLEANAVIHPDGSNVGGKH